MALNLASLVKLIPGKGKAKTGGLSSTPTFLPNSPDVRHAIPQYRDHLLDIYTQRQSLDAKALLEYLFQTDPDVTAALNAFLTVADTEMQVWIRDINGEIQPDAYPTFGQLTTVLGFQTDLTQGFQMKPSLRSICADLRYMALLRGAIAAELVTDKTGAPTEIRIVDAGTLRFFEKVPGQIKPEQLAKGSSNPISLDIPSFFLSYFRNSPLTNYPYSPFIPAINTIAARQQVINDLYRIMQLTGYPRLDVKVLESVLQNAAPASVKADPAKMREWSQARIGEISAAFSGISVDQAFVHTDAVEVGMVNEKASGSTLNVEPIIKVLNAQNQAGLKAVSTILGRGESGVNTASVEARVFSMNADALNGPVGELLSKLFSFAFQLLGYPYFVEIRFLPAELRPSTELEPHLVMRQSRLLETLSLGLITDLEFHMTMFNRPPPPGTNPLSGTNFLIEQNSGVKVGQLSVQNDPLGRAATAPGGDSAKSNTVGGPGSAQSKAKKNG